MTDNFNSTNELGTVSGSERHLIIVELSFLSFTIVTSVLWLIYFINYVLLARRKLHFYQFTSQSYQISRLINCYMDLRRSQLICAILVCAILAYLCMIGPVVFYLERPTSYKNDCNLTFPFDVALYSTPFRVLLFPPGLICSYSALSLVVILTSYLSKAYSINRVVVFREWNLFVWMCVDVIIILLIHSTWFTFVLFYPFIAVIGLLKLILLAIYMRRMNNGIYANAQLEENQGYTRQMKKTYRHYLICSWGLFTFVAAWITINGVLWVSDRVILFITSPCVFKLLFGFEYSFHIEYTGRNIWNTVFQVCDIVEEMLYFILLFIWFTLHLGVFKLLIFKQISQSIKCCRMGKRKFVKSSVLVQPLLK